MIRACPLCGGPLELVADGEQRFHKCPVLQDSIAEMRAWMRYDLRNPPASESFVRPVPAGVLDDLCGPADFHPPAIDEFQEMIKPTDVELETLSPELRARVAPILERMSTGAMRPDDWETLGQLIGEVPPDE